MEESKTFFEKYYKDVFRFLRGLSANEELAEELTQETFYRAWKSRDTYKGNADVRVWLCSILCPGGKAACKLSHSRV